MVFHRIFQTTSCNKIEGQETDQVEVDDQHVTVMSQVTGIKVHFPINCTQTAW